MVEICREIELANEWMFFLGFKSDEHVGSFQTPGGTTNDPVMGDLQVFFFF